MLCRKVWNPKAFKGQVSPHELLQECVRESGKRFKITEEGDPLEFLGWLLNALHKDLGGTKKSGSSELMFLFFFFHCASGECVLLMLLVTRCYLLGVSRNGSNR